MGREVGGLGVGEMVLRGGMGRAGRTESGDVEAAETASGQV